MATQKQIRANRQNALRSNGPRTANGKQHSRMNAVTHGIFANSFQRRMNQLERLQRMRRGEVVPAAARMEFV